MPYDPDVVYHHESPAFVRGVRLACGGLFGLLPGIWLAAYLAPIDTEVVVGITVASVIACAFLAAQYGDEFWHKGVRAIVSFFL